jgi:aldose 1-epimerase
MCCLLPVTFIQSLTAEKFLCYTSATGMDYVQLSPITEPGWWDYGYRIRTGTLRILCWDLIIVRAISQQRKNILEPWWVVRIAHGKFTMDGITYQLDTNNNSHSLHGGAGGFHSVVWEMQQVNDATIQLNYTSADGEEGYPGNVKVTVTYTLTDDDALVMHFEISTDKKTVTNIFNHNFWNLNGEGSGSVAQHQLMIDASHYLAVDSSLIPVGIEAVGNTPFDFSAFHEIGERIHEDHEQLLYGNGYDHNYVLNKGVTEQTQLVASVIGDQSGIRMDILTTEPGLQLYSCNFLKGLYQLKCGAKDEFRSAVCLETQHFPDSPNHASFPSVVLDAGKTYRSETIHKFSLTI